MSGCHVRDEAPRDMVAHMSAPDPYAEITLGGVSFPVKKVSWKHVSPERQTPLASSVSWSTGFTVPLSRSGARKWRAFFDGDRVVCRKCAAIAAGQHSPTRAHHRQCPKRGGTHRGREERARYLERQAVGIGLALLVRRGRRGGTSLAGARYRIRLAIARYSNGPTRHGLAVAARSICGHPCEVETSELGVVRVVPSQPIGPEAVERLRQALMPHLPLGLRLEVCDG